MINNYVKNTCKLGLGNDCCRYLVGGTKGLECAKLTSLKLTIDQRVDSKSFTARGDNCDGLEMEESIKKLNQT